MLCFWGWNLGFFVKYKNQPNKKTQILLKVQNLKFYVYSNIFCNSLLTSFRVEHCAQMKIELQSLIIFTV